MAWHSVAQAQKLTKKSRRTLYRDMASGLVSWRTGAGGRRELETSELIRVYGELSDNGTGERHIVAQQNGTPGNDVLLAEIMRLRDEVAGLRETLMRLEHRPEEAQKPPRWRFWRR